MVVNKSKNNFFQSHAARSTCWSPDPNPFSEILASFLIRSASSAQKIREFHFLRKRTKKNTNFVILKSLFYNETHKSPCVLTVCNHKNNLQVTFYLWLIKSNLVHLWLYYTHLYSLKSNVWMTKVQAVPDQVRTLCEVGTKKILKGGWAILELFEPYRNHDLKLRSQKWFSSSRRPSKKF